MSDSTDPIRLPSEQEAAQAIAAAIRKADSFKPGPTAEEIKGAVDQLRASERGETALRNFFVLLDEGGAGLDTDNLCALKTLVEAILAGRTGAVYHANGR